MGQDIHTFQSKDSLNPLHARAIINQLGATGTPPEFGVGYFTVGLSAILRLLREEYLESFIEWGGSAFKLVIGSYGGGKTHFLYCIRDIAWATNYVTSYVALSPGECPFDKLELVYKAIMANLAYPMDIKDPIKTYEKGIEAFLRYLYQKNKDKLLSYIKNIESSSFTNAIKAVISALQEENTKDYDMVLQWLKGEEPPREIRNKFGITERVDKRTAFRLIRSLAQFIRQVGFSGLVLLFDEAERAMSVATSKEKRVVLDNLRQLIDECGNIRLPGVMIFYAIPDERQLLEEKYEVYEALRQRLSGVISRFNPSGVRIELESLECEPIDFLRMLGEQLAKIYEIAYSPFTFLSTILQKTLRNFAEITYNHRYADVSYRRLFVKSIIQGFHLLKENPNEEINRRIIEKLVKDELKLEEKEILSEIEEREY
jgi:hypothetical protein